MTSSMLAGERRWASARRGGMTVLGKVAVPKPLNLPSQKLENHGVDPNVEIVPKGSLSWGSRPSSSTSNPWGSSAMSPNADGTTGSSSQNSARPSSGGGLSRPSTAGSDRIHDTASSAWGPNSRPSSASGVLTSNQSSLTSSRPRSAETRPGSSNLSRFAEPVVDNSAAWGPNGAAEKLLIPSKNNDFSLSSGDFPTLGSEKDSTGKNTESHDHGSHVRPSSSSGRTGPAKERTASSQPDLKSGTVNTWTRDGPSHVEEVVHPIAEKWQGEPQQYMHPNVPPQHFEAWRGPPMNAPAGVWYRGPPGGPPYPPVPHGGFPMEPYPYYRPQMPPALANSQPVPPPGAGPRGHHPKNGDFYRPQMPDAFIRPGMPMRPGFYPGPVPYDGYYGPPMGYNPNERDVPFMGMPPGPPVYNMYHNPSEPSDAHIRAGGCGPTGNMPVPEQLDSSCPEESQGPYKVLRKRENEWDADVEDENWELSSAAQLPSEKGDQPRPSSRKNERGVDNRRNEDMPLRRNAFVENASSRNLGNRGTPSDSSSRPSSDSVIRQFPDGMGKSKAFDDSWGNKCEIGDIPFPEAPQVLQAKPKDTSLIQKIEGLNAKARASDVRDDTAGVLATPSHDMVASSGDTFKSTTDGAQHLSRRPHHGVPSRGDHHNKGRLNSQDADGWQKKPPALVPESAAAVPNQNVGHITCSQGPDHHVPMEAAEKFETKNTGESLTPAFDPVDGHAQRAKMRELARQRAIQLQKEEEERIREQKAKALAKLEELNRRTLAADGTTQKAEKPVTGVPALQEVDRAQTPPEPTMVPSKHESLSSDIDSIPQVVAQISDSSTSSIGQSSGPSREAQRNSQEEPVVSHGQSLPLKQTVANATDGNKAAPILNDGSFPKQKRTVHRQKQSVHQVEKHLADKPTLVGTSEALKADTGSVHPPGSNMFISGEVVASPEASSPKYTNIMPDQTTHQRRKNNRSGKNKHKVDDASTPAAAASSSSASGETNVARVSSESGKPKSPQADLDPNSGLVIDGKDAVQPDMELNSSLPIEDTHGRLNSQNKPQNSRRMPRNPQVSRASDRFHGSDAVVWAPVRAQNKAEPGDEASQRTVQDVVPPSSKSNNSVQTSLKSKRAEMERYVPKPVAKELAQQGNVQQPAAFSPGKCTPEELTEREESGSQPVLAAAGNVSPAMESKNGDNRHNKQVKPHGAWRQRGSTELDRGQGFQSGSSVSNSGKNYQKAVGRDEVSPPVPTETKTAHEWDPSDGWQMPEYPPPEVAAVTSVVKDQGGMTMKGKKQTYKGQRSTMNHHDLDNKNFNGAEVDKNFMQLTVSLDVNQTNRPVSSKDSHPSHWQPKSQLHSTNSNRGGRSSGGHNANPEAKKDSPPQDGRNLTPQAQSGESVTEYKGAREAPNVGHQGGRERRPASFKGRPQSPNQVVSNMEDGSFSEQHHVSSGFRKNGGQTSRSGGQDNRQLHNATSNREGQRQNSHYEYQPVGSNNNKNSKFNNFDAPTDGSRSTAPRYRERGSGQSRRGGGNFYGRQSGAVRVEAGYD